MNQTVFSRDSFGWTKYSRMDYLCSDSMMDVANRNISQGEGHGGSQSPRQPNGLSDFRSYDQSMQVVFEETVRESQV